MMWFVIVFIVGLTLGAFCCYKVINYFANRTMKTAISNDNGKSFQVMGSVLNTTMDRFGQEMVCYGNKKNEFFVMKRIEFEHKFRNK